MTIDRRTLIATGIAVGAAASLPAQGQPAALAFVPKALPFDPATIAGLSAKLLTSHHDNNYVGAVKRLGRSKPSSLGSIPQPHPAS